MGDSIDALGHNALETRIDGGLERRTRIADAVRAVAEVRRRIRQQALEQRLALDQGHAGEVDSLQVEQVEQHAAQLALSLA